MKPDFEAVAGRLVVRAFATSTGKAGELREAIRAQLRLAYQEGILDGLRQSEEAVKAAFDKFGGRVEP